MFDDAPLFDDVAEGPRGGRAFWARAEDGVRVRFVHWPGGDQGTIVVFPGRTEYAEKYGRTAKDFAERGYHTLAIDWRGQGLADRLMEEPKVGHVGRFTDYQLDAKMMFALLEKLDLPKPYYMIGHSMGGGIGLRTLMEGSPFQAAIFTAPMWGILMNPVLRPFAWALTWSARQVRMGHQLTPTTAEDAYVKVQPFEGNALTTDPEMFAYMQRQLDAHPELALCGPSLHWLHEALVEIRHLARQPSPAIPTATFLGTEEKIVDRSAVHERMGRWPDGQLHLMEGGEHEVMMERPDLRERFYDDMLAHFTRQRKQAA